MSVIHMRQIEASLRQKFAGLLDMSDKMNAKKDQHDKTLLTRSLAAFSVMILGDVSVDQAAASVTDGSQDNGIDALYFHETEHVMYIVQSKWHSNGKGSIERGDAQKFIRGFNDLINARFDRFNSKRNH